MDNEEKRLYHQKYNKAYYIKNKLSKQTETKSYFRKMTSLSDRRNSVEKQLKENEERKKKFIDLLNSKVI
tara:strand:+ start:1361 stop:1570 length:210 start_codon:yes stop_codon:yes gene_type:complete